MPQEITMSAQQRTVSGKRVRQLRRLGLIPAAISSKGETIPIQIETKPLIGVVHRAGQTRLIQLDVDGNTHSVLIREVQHHPVTRQIVHVEFQRVDLREMFRTVVPVELVGDSPAVRIGGVLLHPVLQFHVEALPTDLPPVIQVDISQIKDIGGTLHVRDLRLPPGVRVLDPEDEIVAIVEPPRVEAVEAVEEAELAAAERAARQPAAGEAQE